MSVRRGVAALFVATMLVVAAGCAETRNRDGVGVHIDDASITTTVKARLVEDKTVDADAIQVETAQGNVVLSGVARTTLEKSTVENIAMKVRGVKSVQNNVALRP